MTYFTSLWSNHVFPGSDDVEVVLVAVAVVRRAPHACCIQSVSDAQVNEVLIHMGTATSRGFFTSQGADDKGCVLVSEMQIGTQRRGRSSQWPESAAHTSNRSFMSLCLIGAENRNRLSSTILEHLRARPEDFRR